MPQDATCPKCKHLFPVIEARGAFTVLCPKCDADMTVEFKKPAAPPEAGQPPYDLLVSKGGVPDAAAALRKPKRGSDDDEDEPKRGGGSMAVVLLSGGLGLLMVLGGLGLTAWVLFTQIDVENDTPTANARNSSGNTNTGGNRGNTGGNRGNTGGNGGGNNGGNNGGGNNNPPPPPPKPENEFELRPVSGTHQIITPPTLESDPYTIRLPAQIGAVAVGGNGRYIVMHLPNRQRLAVFDINTAKVTESTEPSDGAGTLIAAGQNRMVTAHNNILRVWTLPDLKRLYDSSGPQLPHGIQSMAMGSATNGPLVVSSVFGHGAVMEVGDRGIKTVDGSSTQFGGGTNTPIRASANGKLYVRGGYGFGDKCVLISESGRKWQSFPSDLASAVPSADGRYVYGFGAINRDRGQSVGQKVGGPGTQTWYLPAVTPDRNYFLRLRETKEGNKQTVAITIHRSQINPEREKAIDVGVLPEAEGLVNFFFRNTVALDQHLFLIPEAKSLVIIPASKDRIVVRRVELR